VPPKNVHVVPHNDGWAVRVEGNSRVSSTYDTKAAAEDAARDRASRDHVELLVHRRDGVITERSSFGHDPYPPKG
jgi:hypothetical protein